MRQYIIDHPGSEADDSLGNFQPVLDGVDDFARNVLAGWGPDAGVAGAGIDYNWSGIIGSVRKSFTNDGAARLTISFGRAQMGYRL